MFGIVFVVRAAQAKNEALPTEGAMQFLKRFPVSSRRIQQVKVTVEALSAPTLRERRTERADEKCRT